MATAKDCTDQQACSGRADIWTLRIFSTPAYGAGLAVIVIAMFCTAVVVVLVGAVKRKKNACAAYLATLAPMSTEPLSIEVYVVEPLLLAPILKTLGPGAAPSVQLAAQSAQRLE